MESPKKVTPLEMHLMDGSKGFMDTKKGLINADLELKFSRRIFDSSTAHEVGIFHYYTIDKD